VNLSGDITRVRAGQELYDPGDLVRLSQSAGRDPGDHLWDVQSAVLVQNFLDNPLAVFVGADIALVNAHTALPVAV